jgi:DNA repair photolyase
VALQPVSNPPNPWLSSAVEYFDSDGEPPPMARLEVYEDHSRSILATNDSPDIGFDYSINPYRGCMHGCAYCYARPGHEYLSFGAGTDFDRKIVVKPKAPELLREAFDKPSWRGELIMFSGVTDCYQPLEASYQVTRGCLQVCADYRNPVAIITKAPLIERDLDVLQELARVTRVGVTISIPLWDPDKARAMEPFVASPLRRIKTIARLAAAGIDVGVNVAPMIPGLGDEDIAEILTAAAASGATRAGFVFLRLPGPVATVFQERVRAALPLRAERILSRVREARGGKLYDSTWGKRQEGEGEYAATAKALFDATCKKLGLNHGERWAEKSDTFRRPPRAGDQLTLL